MTNVQYHHGSCQHVTDADDAKGSVSMFNNASAAEPDLRCGRSSSVQLANDKVRRGAGWSRACRRWLTFSLVCAATVALAGFSDAGQRAGSTNGTPSLGLVASKTPSGVQRRLLKSNELAGFVPGAVTTYTTAGEWVSSPNDQQSAAQAASEKAMLIDQGFRQGAIENLTHGGMSAQGLSLFEQFRSLTAAQRALAYYVSELKKPDVQATDGKYKSFKVAGIPGAVGYSLGGTTGGINISFADSGYYYLVGREGGTRRDVAGLQVAAKDLYRRIHG